MQWIGSTRVFAGMIALAVLLVPNLAFARLDHLVCYKVVDKTQVVAAFDLFAELQPEFSAKGCKPVRVIEFCVPATKLNVTPITANPRADVAGPAIRADYIGYLIKCAEQLPPPNKVVLDQFGPHRQRGFKLYKVLVPAKKGPPPCGTVDGKLCGGVCPDAANECRVDTDGVCKCVPPEDNLCGGKPDKQGQCGGPCPDPAKPQCRLTVSTTGAKVCECGPPPPPVCGINAATGTCGGECPNKADKCVLKSPTDCTCAPAEDPCTLVVGTPAPSCGGDCPIAGDVCVLDANNACTCGPPPTGDPCDRNPLTGTCGGECPVGLNCHLDSANQCTCGPSPCGSDATGQCAGGCPNTTQTCHADASGACNCDPPSCTSQGTSCGGLCPVGSSCAQVAIGGALTCRCQ